MVKRRNHQVMGNVEECVYVVVDVEGVVQVKARGTLLVEELDAAALLAFSKVKEDNSFGRYTEK